MFFQKVLFRVFVFFTYERFVPHIIVAIWNAKSSISQNDSEHRVNLIIPRRGNILCLCSTEERFSGEVLMCDAEAHLICLMQVLPGELASEAWNTEKFMSAYEARKKLEMMGAMTFSSAGDEKNTISTSHVTQSLQHTNSRCDLLPTDENESQSDGKGEEISSQGFVVFTVTLRKACDAGVDVIFT